MIVKVKTLLGELFTYEVQPEDPIDRIKELFSAEANITKETQNLVHKGKIVKENSITTNGIQDGDFLVVFAVRPSPVAVSEKKVESQSPRKVANEDESSEDSDAEMVEESGEPSFSQLLPQLQDLMDTLSNLRNPPQLPAIDEVSLRSLQDMGFSDQRATKALLLNRMNSQAAMEWLLEHNSDPDIDSPLMEEQLRQLAGNDAEFELDEDAAQRLQEMGFSESDVKSALRATNNNYEAACAWCLGDRDIEESLDDNNPLINEILSNPTVQSGLTNPRVLQAFRSMLDNPSSTEQYINDPEIGPVLLQVSNILHQNPNN